MNVYICLNLINGLLSGNSTDFNFNILLNKSKLFFSSCMVSLGVRTSVPQIIDKSEHSSLLNFQDFREKYLGLKFKNYVTKKIEFFLI